LPARAAAIDDVVDENRAAVVVYLGLLVSVPVEPDATLLDAHARELAVQLVGSFAEIVSDLVAGERFPECPGSPGVVRRQSLALHVRGLVPSIASAGGVVDSARGGGNGEF
jgi:hypothetical protein